MQKNLLRVGTINPVFYNMLCKTTYGSVELTVEVLCQDYECRQFPYNHLYTIAMDNGDRSHEQVEDVHRLNHTALELYRDTVG